MSRSYALLLPQLREKRPLVHHITNYVTVNDCANITLAIGASPVMADDMGEVADITAIAQALVLNMGTLNERTIPAMLKAGQRAKDRGIPIVLDPVGAGASKLRSETAARLIRELNISVLRGNISEIKCIAGLHAETRGVDAAADDAADERCAGQLAKTLANQLGSTVVISGETDVISDGVRIAFVKNGISMLGDVSGTGCMCASLIGAFLGSAAEDVFPGALMAMVTMGVAGELAFEQAGKLGIGSFRIALHDAVSQMDVQTLEKRGHYHEA